MMDFSMERFFWASFHTRRNSTVHVSHICLYIGIVQSTSPQGHYVFCFRAEIDLLLGDILCAGGFLQIPPFFSILATVLEIETIEARKVATKSMIHSMAPENRGESYLSIERVASIERAAMDSRDVEETEENRFLSTPSPPPPGYPPPIPDIAFYRTQSQYSSVR